MTKGIHYTGKIRTKEFVKKTKRKITMFNLAQIANRFRLSQNSVTVAITGRSQF